MKKRGALNSGGKNMYLHKVGTCSSFLIRKVSGLSFQVGFHCQGFIEDFFFIEGVEGGM